MGDGGRSQRYDDYGDQVTSRQITGVALKCFALYLLLNVILLIPWMVISTMDWFDSTPIALTILANHLANQD